MSLPISIIIPHWNTPNSLEKLLILIGKNPNQNGFEVIVVDNNSKIPPQTLVEKFPNVKFIFNQSNFGFAMACNMGVTHAKGEWLLFLHTDVIVTSSQIKKIVDYAISKNIEVLSSLPEDNYPKPLPTLTNLLIEYSPLSKLIKLDSSKKVLNSSFFLIKDKVLQDLGGWDERFFLWFEDSDLSKRLYDNKYAVSWYPENILHQGGRSIKILSKQKQKDIFFYALNNYAVKYFKQFDQKILALNNLRFSKRKTLPIMEDGIALVVPNVKIQLLKSFLIDNWPALKNDIKSGFVNLIIVSNALNNKNIWQYRAEFPEVRFILLNKNQGFAKTVNIGWKASTKKWLGTINDDTIIDSNWMVETKKYLTDQIGSVNPLIIDIQGNIESAGINILPIGKALPITTKSELHFYQTQATNGAAVIYNHKALESVGFFDERFGSYLEDIDLSLRLSKNSYYNTVITTTQVFHKKHATSKKMGKYKKWLDFKNWWLVIIKNWPMIWWLKYFPQILIERARNFWGIFK